MTEYCENILTIDGLLARECISQIQGVERCIDFERICPMPEILADTDFGPLTRYGRIVVGRADESEISQMLQSQAIAERGIQTNDQLKTFLLKEHPGCLEVGKRTARAMDETGFSHWVFWKMANWGTRWNPDRSELTKCESVSAAIHFETVWTPPLPVIIRLSEQWQALQVTLTYKQPAETSAGEFTVLSGTLSLQAGKGTWERKTEAGKVRVDQIGSKAAA